MVFFTCQHCGSSLKKNAVENHYFNKCRNVHPHLTCVDCLKDFFGNEYAQHTSCLTENEKYGKGFKSKPPSDKNAKKQDSWSSSIQEMVIQPGMNWKLVSIINHCKNQGNVPQKRQKFQNFCKSITKTVNVEEIDDLFDLFTETHKRKTEQQKLANGKAENTTSADRVQNGKPQDDPDPEEKNEETLQNGKEEETKMAVNVKCKDLNVKKLSKKEMKALKKKTKSECIDGQNSNECDVSENQENENIENERQNDEMETFRSHNGSKMNGHVAGDSPPTNSEMTDDTEKRLTKRERKKLEKRKRFEAEMNEIENYQKPDDDGEENGDGGEDAEKEDKKKKRKQKKRRRDSEMEVGERGCEPVQKRSKAESESQHDTMEVSKEDVIKDETVTHGFKWDEVIIQVLQSKGNELPIKRLSKKVIAEYMSTRETTHESFETISAKFNKKLKKIPGVKVLKDRAKLVT